QIPTASLLALVLLSRAAGLAAETPVTLASHHLELAIDRQTGELATVLNRYTGARKSVREAAFAVLTDRGAVYSGQARLLDFRQQPLGAVFRFEAGGLEMELSFRLRSQDAHFAEKLLAITNRTVQPVVLESLTLVESAFTPAPIQVKFHTAGIPANHPVVSPDVPINLFLRDTGGGVFLGIENPYFSFARSGNTLALQYRPRWRLEPGARFESEPAFLGVYRNEGVYAFKSMQASAAGQPPRSGAQELLDWGEVWAMQDFMRQVLVPGRPPGRGYPVIYNACGGMEYLWRLREAP